MTIRSEAFHHGQPIPKKHTGEGEDVSPALSWSNVPPTAKELALICDDPDAPTPEPWVHWVIYKIPVSAQGLPEHVEPSERLNAPIKGALQGKNTWPTIGYRGPMPPPGHGRHRYYFKLYALNAPLTLGPGADKAKLEEAMSGHIVAKAETMGTYERK
jgi:Raf kinase inhibitor-like YbhB/YbcL family protein